MSILCHRLARHAFLKTTLSRNCFEAAKQITKKEATNICLQAKRECNVTFDSLAKSLNVNKVWLTSAMLGRHPINQDIATKLLEILKINKSTNLIQVLGDIPENRSDNVAEYEDPVLNRFREMINVYGPTFKTLIREEAGDGVMSAIDCVIDFDKEIVTKDGQEEVRIVIKINGKYLQYKN